MKTVGVICEYNPFHRGHAWQLAALRERYGASSIVCVMSGNFVQRGECAICRKHPRAAAAVEGGADLVLELPLPWAIASAEGFARGGVAVLHAMGCVDTLAFGSECGETAALLRAADALLRPEYPGLLHTELDKGNSFAAARQEAVRTLIGEEAQILASPNDILGVEYCKALHASGSTITPLALPRVGASHDGGAVDEIASASLIRARLRAGGGADDYLTPGMSERYRAEEAAGRAPVCAETAERMLLARLRMMTEEDLAPYDEGREGLYHRFYEVSRSATSVRELLERVKTKRYAYARLRRMLLHIALGVLPSEAAQSVPYLRVLACNERGRALLHEMRTRAALPVLTKSADVRSLSEQAQHIFVLEARATELYTLLYPALSAATGGSEWTTGPVIL